jgi:hypothetical protein
MWFQYLDLVKSFEIQRTAAINGLPDDEHKQGEIARLPTPEFMALAELKILRQCCRRMFLCQHDMYEKIR